MSRTRPARPWPAVGLLALLAVGRAPAADELFEREVRPVLVEQCQKCHGPKKQHGGLRLDSRAAMLTGGDSGPAVVPGKPVESRLIEAVRRSGELKMPPDKPLTARQVEALTRWVEQGAAWPADRPAPTTPTSAADHWAFRPVRPVEPPAVPGAATEIDRFILALLKTEGLTPSPPADRRTLIRRASYDLLGLPPTPDDVTAFVNDTSPNAYEKLIDRLLASPHYGEHWGRHWLDVARYSDTKGYVYAREERFWVHAWAYRDWVVRALNQDMPYDRFVRLQLAADQLAPDDPSAQAAMGFLTLGRRFLGVTHDIIDDRIDAVTRGFLGLTVACARCHDHKFDPIPTADYYALYGVFRSCSERQVPAEPVPDAGPFSAGLKERQRKLADMLALRRREAADRLRARIGEYLAAQLEMHKYPEEGFDQLLGPADLIPHSVRRWREHLARSAVTRDPVFAAWHAFARLPAAEFRGKATGVSRELPSPAVNPLVAKAFAVPPRDMADVARRYADLFARVDPRRRSTVAAVAGGLVVPLADATEAAPFVRILTADDGPCAVPDEPIVDTEGYFPSVVVNELWALQGEVDRWLIRQPTAPAFATVMVDRPMPTDARVLRRGNPASPGAEVPRRFLEVVGGPSRRPFANGSGRLELANAIADAKNPLTARVMVNRVWMHHFGAGLVRTPSDFGTRAEPPSHPELLDWLAARFVADGWSLKALHRRVMLSAAYRQSSAGPAESRDPENRLLGKWTARRLSFEELRDTLFAVTGDLQLTVGGKPFDLFAEAKPARRTVYALIDRQFSPDLLRAFDAANPDLHTPQRSETIVPQQALFFLNHPLPLERAKALAAHPTVIGTPEQKVAAMYRLAYQREPTPGQVRAALALLKASEAESPPVPPKPSAWSYGVAALDTKTWTLAGFRPLPHFAGDAWQGGPTYPDAALGWAKLTADGGHPGNDLGHAVVRRWTAPSDGTVRVRSTLVHEVAAGDGMRGSILNSRHGLLATAIAHNGKAQLDVPAVAVKAGDTLDFVADRLAVLNNDQFLWAPVVTADGTTWDAKAGFGGPSPNRLPPWAALAQVLLMANEFCFVD